MAVHYSKRARIDAPIDIVWKVLTDAESMPEWTPSMKSVRFVDEGSLVLGARVQIRQPRMPAMTWVIDQLTPGRYFRWSAESATTITHGEHWLEPRSNGQQTEVKLAISHTGPLAGVIGALTMRRTARYVDMEVQGLKTASEARAGALPQ